MNWLAAALLLAVWGIATSDLVYKRNENFNKTYIFNRGHRYTLEHGIEQCESLNATVVLPESVDEARWLSATFNLKSDFWIGLSISRLRMPDLRLDGSRVTHWLYDAGSTWVEICTAAKASRKTGWWWTTSCDLQYSLICVQNRSFELYLEQLEKMKALNMTIDNCVEQVESWKKLAEKLAKEKEVLVRRIDTLQETVRELSERRHGHV